MSEFISINWLRIKKLLYTFINPYLFLKLCQFRILAGLEHKHVLSKKISTIVDIGANKGQFALAANEYTSAKIISFEPLSKPAEKFKKIFKNNSNVSLKKIAIGPTKKVSDINVTNNDDSSSFLKVGNLQESIFKSKIISTESVEVMPLENVINSDEIIQPALLKIDVQGYEQKVIEGCLSLINNFNYIYCECSFVELYKNQALAYEIINQLNELGFNLEGIYNVYYKDGNLIQADILFTKKDINSSTE